MTDEMMSLRTLLEKSSDADLLREMVGFAAQRLMELEVESLTGAAHGERHEWKVWREVKLPEGKILIPGVVSHATNVVEHPEVVADRILNFATVAGRENVIAGTDCGLGGRIHPQLVWAKLDALVAGAQLATNEQWS